MDQLMQQGYTFEEADAYIADQEASWEKNQLKQETPPEQVPGLFEGLVGETIESGKELFDGIKNISQLPSKLRQGFSSLSLENFQAGEDQLDENTLLPGSKEYDILWGKGAQYTPILSAKEAEEAVREQARLAGQAFGAQQQRIAEEKALEAARLETLKATEGPSEEVLYGTPDEDIKEISLSNFVKPAFEGLGKAVSDIFSGPTAEDTAKELLDTASEEYTDAWERASQYTPPQKIDTTELGRHRGQLETIKQDNTTNKVLDGIRKTLGLLLEMQKKQQRTQENKQN